MLKQFFEGERYYEISFVIRFKLIAMTGLMSMLVSANFPAATVAHWSVEAVFKADTNGYHVIVGRDGILARLSVTVLY